MGMRDRLGRGVLGTLGVVDAEVPMVGNYLGGVATACAGGTLSDRLVDSEEVQHS